jgi:small-conductance mechanosensitive channel
VIATRRNAGADHAMRVIPQGPTRARAAPAAFAVVALLALFATAARAADAPAPPAGDAAVAAPVAAKHLQKKERPKEGTVVVFNRPIVTFRAEFLGTSPVLRAEAAEQRIAGLLAAGGPGKVVIEPQSQGVVVKIDDSLAFVVTEGDASALLGQTVESVAQDAVRALTRAIDETHEARNGARLVQATIWAAGATTVYLALLWFLRWLGRTVTRRVLRLAGETAGHLRIGGAEVLQRGRTIRVVASILRLGFWAIVLLVTYEWVGFVLGRFPFTRVWGEQLNAFLVDSVIGALAATAAAVPDLIVVAAIFVLARSVVGVFGNFFDGVQSGRVKVGWIDADSARPTRRLVTMAVWVFALVMAYPYIPGSDSDAFKGLSVLIGLMVSVGASGIVGQAASGLILMYTRTYRPGEYVRIGDHEGTVVEMGMFTSRIRTGLGEELTLPNSFVLSAVTKNYSRTVRGAGFVLDTAVTIGYDAPWRQVHAMLLEAAARTEDVLADPKPHVFQTALSDFYVEYRLVCQAVATGPRPRAELLSSLHANVQDVFNEHGVQIMSPHYLGDPAEAKVVPKARWFTPPAAPPTTRG